MTTDLAVQDLSTTVEAALRPEHYEAGDAAFGWQLHESIHSRAHLLVTCQVGDGWRLMPAQAVAAALAQHLARYADTLTNAGLGVVTWGRRDQAEVLIVAGDQQSADQQAADVRAYLSKLNGEAS